MAIDGTKLKAHANSRPAATYEHIVEREKELAALSRRLLEEAERVDAAEATRIRVKDGLSYGIGSQLSVPTKEDAATFLTYAISAPQNTAKVEGDFYEELKCAVQNGFTDTEIAAVKSG